MLNTARDPAGRAHAAGGMCCARHAHEHHCQAPWQLGMVPCHEANGSRCTTECTEQRHSSTAGVAGQLMSPAMPQQAYQPNAILTAITKPQLATGPCGRSRAAKQGISDGA